MSATADKARPQELGSLGHELFIVGLFGALSGFLANFFLTPASEDVGTDGTAPSNDPIRMLTELEDRFTAELAAIRDEMARPRMM